MINVVATLVLFVSPFVQGQFAEALGRFASGTGGGLTPRFRVAPLMAAADRGHPEMHRYRGRKEIAAPGAVTDLRAVAVTDTSAVIEWTETRSNTTAIAKYVVRRWPIGSGGWSANVDVTTGGCGAPVYGSTSGGGRKRACVLTGLGASRAYDVQLVAYTGTLNSTAVFGPLSNVASVITAVRVGPMLVQRPPGIIDSVRLTQVEFSDWPNTRWPIRGTFWMGDHFITAYNADTVVARGFLLVVRP